MSKTISHIKFAELLAPSIAGDPKVAAAAESLDALVRRTTLAVPNLLIWARLDRQAGLLIPPLARVAEAAGGLKPHNTTGLELLAWQLHVDFRDVATTDEMLEAFVRNSIPWHRIKGTPRAIEEALALYGVVAKCDESGRGTNWAVYELELLHAPTTSELKNIVRVAEISAPLRSQLRRLHDEHDFRPLVWDETPGWDHDLYDDDSGVWNEETGLKLSFGNTHILSTEPFSRTGHAALWRERERATLIHNDARPLWDVFQWDSLPAAPARLNLVRYITRTHAWGIRRHVGTWTGTWDYRPWRRLGYFTHEGLFSAERVPTRVSPIKIEPLNPPSPYANAVSFGQRAERVHAFQSPGWQATWAGVWSSQAWVRPVYLINQNY